MKTKLYLDTSVPSAYFDTSKPVRQLMTQKWFENDASNFDLYISILTLEEISHIQNQEKLAAIKELIISANMTVLELTEGATQLGDEYMKQGLFRFQSRKMRIILPLPQ